MEILRWFHAQDLFGSQGELPQEGLVINKRLSRLPLNKKFGTHLKKSIVFNTLTNLVLPKRSHNPKTWKHIHTIFGIQPETSLLIKR